MNKRQLIDDIRRFNITAPARFLAQFDELSLKQYLENLKAAQDKRIRVSPFVNRQPKFRLVS